MTQFKAVLRERWWPAPNPAMCRPGADSLVTIIQIEELPTSEAWPRVLSVTAVDEYGGLLRCPADMVRVEL